jgi:recombination protein RecA
MAKKVQESSGKSKIQETLDRLNKTYGVGTVLALDSKTSGDYDVISTGSIGFDYITLGVGGFVKGKMYELMGWEGCLAEDTYIKFINVREDGIVQDCKGSTIKNLYERFHNRTALTMSSIFNVTSINDEDRIFRNPILDVVKSGVKECYELTTENEFRIKTTRDHKFYTGTDYKSLKDLVVGDTVFIHNNTPFTKKKASHRGKYIETTMKFYYRGKPRMINGSPYFRERVHRLVFEAAQNNISYAYYKKMLNTGYLPIDFWTIPEGYDVHHIDENTLNNDPLNLELLDNSSHGRLHALANHNNLRFMVTPDIIKSITSVGEVETYDIKCEFPYNNFIAEGIVVHNSGKSTICGHAAAECQKKGGVVLYIDGEHAVDKHYFQQIGIDTTKMLISQPSSGEEGFNIALEMINSGGIDLIIIDSDSSFIPKKVLDGEIGEFAIGKKAVLNSNAYPKLKSALSSNNVCIIVVSQYREKIGMMFGNPTTTQGGHALKFYSDCRIEISKSLAKEGDVTFGNLTKVKSTKNKMSPPYRLANFDVVYGKGIDKLQEIMKLGDEFGLLKKWGKIITYNNNKYDAAEFKVLLQDNEEFFDELKREIIKCITNTSDLPTDPSSEEPITEESSQEEIK